MAKKIDRKTWTTSTEKILYNKFQELADRTHIPKTHLLDEAIQDLLQKYAEKKGIVNSKF